MSDSTPPANAPDAPSATIEPADLERVPMFPLPDVVLFPGAVLPLHIFEPRYRQLTRDALSGSGLIAMAKVRDTEPADVAAPPAVCDVAGLGHIHASRELEDGRYVILLRGVARVGIDNEIETGLPYRQVAATQLEDVPAELPSVLLASEVQLTQMCDRIAETLEDGSELKQLIRLGETPGERADLIAATLVHDADERQALLEELNPCTRIDRLIEIVAEAMAEVGVERTLN